ncbi:MAG TPA: O-antigen ligase family protein [Burkholderiales bacterium]|nr:O-antigen ligase family protein [Burkholderiales bacterium]
MKPETLLAWVAALFLAACLFSHTVALRLLLLAAGIVLASITIARDRHGIKALPPIWLPFLLWGLWAAASIAWSVEPDRSEKEWRNEVFYTGAALWICFVGAQARNAGRIVLPVLGITITAAIAIALWTYSRGWTEYLVGWHSGPGDHSSALLTLLPCLAMAAWYGSRAGWARPVRVLMPLLAVLFAASAYFTLNRTLWLGFAVQLMLLGGLLLMRSDRFQRARLTRQRILSACVALIAVISLAFFSIQATREATGTGKALQADPRLLLWPEVVEQIAERPLVGYGFGRGLLREPLREDFGTLDSHLWHTHNIVLEALVQGGLSGLVLLALLLGMLLREGWRYARSADERTMACGIALIGVVAGMVVRNMTDTLFVRQNSLFFWGMAGVLLGLPLSGSATSTPAPSAAAARAPRPG